MPQSLVTLRTHLVFSTKNRERLITPAVEDELHRYLAGILKAKGSPAIEIGGYEDHVHVLFSLSKTVALSEVVCDLKSDSSKWIKGRGSSLSEFYWQAGYAAFSIGRSGEADLVRYIRRQHEHHRRHEFKDELRAFLHKYEVEYDERYVWD
jgi:REP element-mobilizing transposase RayT